MINMGQRAELHRILDNMILLSNSGTDVRFEFTHDNLKVEYRTGENPAWFTSIPLSEPMAYSHLISTAEILEKEMGVEI